MADRVEKPIASPRAQALVEFALVLPLLVILIVGLFDFGRAVYTYNAIANAARTGNRVAIVNQNEAAIRTAARDNAVWTELGDSDVDIDFECTQIGCIARVDVSTSYDPAMPVIGGLFGPIDMSASSEMPIERVFVGP
jgi:Flp pilus assembly protein TadG